MSSDVHTASVDHAFFLPLDGLAAASPHALACREFPDDAFIRLGIQRVLENEHGITHRAEDLRREQRTHQAAKVCAMKGLVLPALVQAAKRASQHSLKFIRWLRRSLRDKLTEHAALPLLRTLYASS